MTLRSNSTIKLHAHAILDDIRAGIHHEPAAVTWALRVLGEPAYE